MKQNMSIRIISLISCFAILVSCLVLPAAASESESDSQTSAYQPQFVDLMNYSIEYEMQAYKNGTHTVTQFMKDPVVQVNQTGFGIHFIWGDKYERVNFDYILFCLEIPNRPDAVSLNNKSASLVGYSPGYFYYKAPGGAMNAVFDIFVDMSSNRGSLQLVSCFGVVDSSVQMDEVNLFTMGQLVSDGQYYMQSYFDGSVSLPYFYQKTFSSDSPSVSPSQFFVDIDFPMPVPYAESVSITFYSSNVWPNYYSQDTLTQGGVALVQGSDGDPTEVLPYIVSDSIVSGTMYGQPLYVYTVTVDLRGIEFDDSTHIKFRTYLGKMYQNATSGNTSNFYCLGILSCSYRNDIHNKPWYVRFFYWIKSEFTDFKQTIVENSSVGVLNDINSQVSESNNIVNQQHENLNQQIADYQTDWTNQTSTMYPSASEAINALGLPVGFMASYAEKIFLGMSWFGKIYLTIGLFSIFMLLLSKSGIVNKIANSRESSGDS